MAVQSFEVTSNVKTVWPLCNDYLGTMKKKLLHNTRCTTASSRHCYSFLYFCVVVVGSGFTICQHQQQRRHQLKIRHVINSYCIIFILYTFSEYCTRISNLECTHYNIILYLQLLTLRHIINIILLYHVIKLLRHNVYYVRKYYGLM